MTDDETPLQMATRHVAQLQAAIATQKQIIEKLQDLNQPTDLRLSGTFD